MSHYPLLNGNQPAPGSRGTLTSDHVGRTLEILTPGHASIAHWDLSAGDKGKVTSVMADGKVQIQWTYLYHTEVGGWVSVPSNETGFSNDFREGKGGPRVPMFLDPREPATFGESWSNDEVWGSAWKFTPQPTINSNSGWAEQETPLEPDNYVVEPTHVILTNATNPNLVTKTNVENVVGVGELGANDTIANVNEVSVSVDVLTGAEECRSTSSTGRRSQHAAQRRKPTPPGHEYNAPPVPVILAPPEPCYAAPFYMPNSTEIAAGAPEDPSQTPFWDPTGWWQCPSGMHVEFNQPGVSATTGCCLPGSPFAVTYDCVNGICVQRLGGEGEYPTIDACSVACAGTTTTTDPPGDGPPTDPPDVPCANPSDPGCDAHLECDFTITPSEDPPNSVVGLGSTGNLVITYDNCQIYDSVHGCGHLVAGAFSDCDYVVETDEDLSSPLINGHDNPFKEGSLVMVSGLNQVVMGVYPIKNVHSKGFTITNRTEGRTPLSGVGADETIGAEFHVVHLRNNKISNSLFTDLYSGDYGGPEWDHWTEPLVVGGTVGGTTITDPQGELDYALRNKAMFSTGGWGNTDPHQNTDYNQFAAYQDIDVVAGDYYLDWLGTGKIFCDTALSGIGIGVDIVNYLSDTPGIITVSNPGTIRLYISSDLETGTGGLGSTATYFERVTLVPCN